MSERETSVLMVVMMIMMKMMMMKNESVYNFNTKGRDRRMPFFDI